MVLLKGPPQQVLAHAVGVELQGRVDGHDVTDEVQVAEGHPGLQRVGADAPIRPEHVVHVQLGHALLGLLLEGGGAGGKVRVLVAEELVADLAGQQHPDVGIPVDGPAAQVHAHAGPDGGDVPGAQDLDDLRQCLDDLIPGHVHLRVVGADKVGGLPGVLEVDGVGVHADGKGADLPAQDHGADGAHQGGVQPAGEQEAQRGVGVQPLVHGGDQLLADPAADGVQVPVPGHVVPGHGGGVGVADEPALGVVVARGEGKDLAAQTHQVFRLAGEHDGAGAVVAVVQGADADGVPGGHQGAGGAVVEHQSELRVQPGEHLQTVLPPQGQQDFAVAAAAEGVALFLQLPLQGPEAVELAVAHHIVAVQLEGLHARLGQPHDGQTVEAEIPGGGLHDPGHVGAPGERAVKAGADLLRSQRLAGKTHDGTHRKHLQKQKAQLHPNILGRIAAIRGAT